MEAHNKTLVDCLIDCIKIGIAADFGEDNLIPDFLGNNSLSIAAVRIVDGLKQWNHFAS